jgi:hypothetical protein
MRRHSVTLASGMTCAGIALGSALLVGSTVAALAQSANHAYGGCSLDLTTTVQDLLRDINNTGSFNTAQLKVSFVIVYTMNNNDGQRLGGNSYSGVILCKNPDEVSIQPTTETTVIPNVDIKDIEQTYVLRYQLNGGSGAIEKRVCQQTDANTDCFRVSPP